MALPSIVLLIVFVVSSAESATPSSLRPRLFSFFDYGSLPGLPYGLAARLLVSLVAVPVPITIAAFAAGLALQP
jgi:hypothetical protein